jgi:hypothetical protein
MQLGVSQEIEVTAQGTPGRHGPNAPHGQDSPPKASRTPGVP